MPTIEAAPASSTPPVFPTLAMIEREVIEGRLRLFEGNKALAARSLGISLKTLYNRLNEWKAADASGGHA